MPAPLRDVPEAGIELIQSFEGIPDGDPSTVNIDAYLDPVGIWTIGWGHAITYQGGFLRGAQNQAIARSLYPGGITRAQAETLLRGDLLDTAAAVGRLVTVDLDDAAFGALVSFAFNVGSGNLAKSTLLRRLNAGDRAGAADQFLAWNQGRVNGVLQPLPGLTRRRRAERALFLGDDWRAAAQTRSAGPGRPAAAPKSKLKSKLKPKAKPKAKPEAKPPRRPVPTGRARTTPPTAPRPAAPARRRRRPTAR